MKNKLLALLLALLLSLGLLAYSFMPRTLAVDDTTDLALAKPASPPPGMRVFAFDAGSMSATAAMAFRGGAFGESRTFTMGGVVVQHPGGTLLFDTGFGRDVKAQIAELPLPMRASATYVYGTPIVDQLQRAGIAWQSFAGIVPTHVHWDHVSGVPDMPGIPVWLPKAERDFVDDGGLASQLIRRLGDVKYRIYDFPSGPYLGFARSYDVFGDGSVVLVHAGGHTPGSVLAFITPPSGPRYALIGDLAWQAEGVSLPAERPWLTRTLVDFDPALVREVLVRLHRLQKRYPDLVIVPAHDPKAWARLPHAGM